MSDDSESHRAYDRRMFSDAAVAWRKADCIEQAANERAQHLADIAAEAAFYATEPTPLDRSNVRGLNRKPPRPQRIARRQRQSALPMKRQSVPVWPLKRPMPTG